MARKKQPSEFDIEVEGERYVWRLQRRPQWSSESSERRGMIIAVRHADGQREAVIEFPPGPQPRFGLRQLQATQIDPQLVAQGVASAIGAGWEPFSRGRPVAIVVDEKGG